MIDGVITNSYILFASINFILILIISIYFSQSKFSKLIASI